jgi:hypothetical protein
MRGGMRAGIERETRSRWTGLVQGWAGSSVGVGWDGNGETEDAQLYAVMHSARLDLILGFAPEVQASDYVLA